MQSIQPGFAASRQMQEELLDVVVQEGPEPGHDVVLLHTVEHHMGFQQAVADGVSRNPAVVVAGVVAPAEDHPD